MNIQLALDRLTIDQCFQILKETETHIDWIEIGTGVIKEYGMAIIREIKEAYPYKTIVADMKTCDAGKFEAIQAFEAGADITTVMAFSADKTIKDTLEAANQYKKRVMIDLLGVTEQKRMIELKDLGVNLVSLHFGKDMQQEGEFHTDLFTLIEDFPQFEVAVAGGINLQSLPAVLKKKPNTIIVGSAITKAENCFEAASKMKGMIKEYEIHH
jgi:3-hexulose-6-phosphate synthase